MGVTSDERSRLKSAPRDSHPEGRTLSLTPTLYDITQIIFMKTLIMQLIVKQLETGPKSMGLWQKTNTWIHRRRDVGREGMVVEENTPETNTSYSVTDKTNQPWQCALLLEVKKQVRTAIFAFSGVILSELLVSQKKKKKIEWYWQCSRRSSKWFLSF